MGRRAGCSLTEQTGITPPERHGRSAVRAGCACVYPVILGMIAIPLSAAPRGSTLEPLVVTAARENVLSGLEVLASETMLDPIIGRPWSETLAQVPGLVTQPGFGGFDPPRLAVRGSGIQSAPTSRGLWISFLDMPLNAADGSFNLALLESSWLDSAELVGGPAGAVPALGGALAFGSSNDFFKPGGALTMATGSDEALAVGASGCQGSEQLALASRAAYTRWDGWRPHSRQERECMVAGARLAWDDDTDLTIQVLGSHPWYEVPGPLTRDQALHDPTGPVAAVQRDQPRRESEYVQFFACATKRWSGAEASLGWGGVSYQDDFRQLLANGISTTDALESNLLFHVAKDWEPANQRTELTARLQAGWWDVYRYRNNRGNRGMLIGDQDLRPLTLTSSLDHQFAITSNQKIEVGLSALTAKRDIDDQLNNPHAPPVDLTWSGTRCAARAAWSWSPVKEATLVAAWARSYEPPTYNDLLFTDGPPNARLLRSAPLDWQRADSFELSLRGQHESVSWSSSLYHARWRDEFLRLANPDGSSRGTVNADDTIHNGWESRIQWDLMPDSAADLTFWTTYNYSLARFDGDPVYGDGRLAGVPPHCGAVGVSAASPGGWFVAPMLQWQGGSTYADHAHDLEYGGFCLWSLEFGRRHPAGWSATVGVHNIFNRRAIVSTTGVLDRAADPDHTAIFLPANHRTLEVRLEYSW